LKFKQLDFTHGCKTNLKIFFIKLIFRILTGVVVDVDVKDWVMAVVVEIVFAAFAFAAIVEVVFAVCTSIFSTMVVVVIVFPAVWAVSDCVSTVVISIVSSTVVALSKVTSSVAWDCYNYFILFHEIVVQCSNTWNSAKVVNWDVPILIWAVIFPIAAVVVIEVVFVVAVVVVAFLFFTSEHLLFPQHLTIIFLFGLATFFFPRPVPAEWKKIYLVIRRNDFNTYCF